MSADSQPFFGQHGGAAASNGQEVASKFRDVKLNLVWFAAACCVLLGGLFGALDLLLTDIAPLDFLDEVYLMVFGSVMFVLDAPLPFKFILEVRSGVCKYVRLLTRLCGRGAWYIFLGTMTFATLWENRVSYFLAVVLGLFVFGVGVFSITFGYVKSRKLEKIRVQMEAQYNDRKLENLYRSFAKASQEVGLTKQEFSDLAQNVKGVSFAPAELAYIFGALCQGIHLDNLPYKDLEEWATRTETLCFGKMVFL